MRKTFKFFSVILPVLIVIVIGNYVIVAQSTVSGEWKADSAGRSDGKVEIKFIGSERRDGKRSRMGNTFELNELRGLKGDDLKSERAAVKFQIVREAGTVECTGTFVNGAGSGKFVFSPSSDFVAAMSSRGIEFRNRTGNTDDNGIEHQLFAAFTFNVTAALADDLISNFGKIESDDLFKARIFKIDGSYAREMKDAGYPNLTFDDLVKAKIFKIDGEFLRSMTAAGFTNVPFESLVKFKIFKITPEFINEIRAEGFADLEIEQLVKMRIFKIDAEFIRKARAEGVPMDVEKLVQRRIGVWR